MSESTVVSDTIHRLSSREAVIGVIGLGYVGLPLALPFSEVGYRVLGFDVDQSKVARLTSGCSYIGRISAARVGAAVGNDFAATSEFRALPKLTL